MSRGNAERGAEVVIVGGGPAGLACAIAAARSGMQVEVIDGLRPPIDKSCGEGLMPDSLQALAAIGVSLDYGLGDPGLGFMESYPLRGIRFIGGSGAAEPDSVAEAAFPELPGRGIRRTLLHQILFEHATSLGVGFHWENSVQSLTSFKAGTVVRTNRQTLRARYLVGADGSQSRVARWAGLEASSTYSRRIGLRQHYAVSPWTDFVEVYWGECGQAYVTPVSATEVCVAFISDRKMASPAETPARFPALQRHLTAASAIDAPRGSMTLGRRLRRVVTGSIALAGDASGSVDAVTGEGLALCFRQAAALAVAMQANDLAGYESAHRRIQRLPALMSRSLLLLDRSPRLRVRALRAFERHPRLFDALLRTHIGHSPVRVFGSDGLLAAGLHILAS